MQIGGEHCEHFRDYSINCKFNNNLRVLEKQKKISLQGAKAPLYKKILRSDKYDRIYKFVIINNYTYINNQEEIKKAPYVNFWGDTVNIFD